MFVDICSLTHEQLFQQTGLILVEEIFDSVKVLNRARVYR